MCFGDSMLFNISECQYQEMRAEILNFYLIFMFWCYTQISWVNSKHKWIGWFITVVLEGTAIYIALQWNVFVFLWLFSPPVFQLYLKLSILLNFRAMWKCESLWYFGLKEYSSPVLCSAAQCSLSCSHSLDLSPDPLGGALTLSVFTSFQLIHNSFEFLCNIWHILGTTVV